MLKSCGGWWVVAYRILVSAPVPFWVYLGWNWVGSGWDWARGDLGLKGWGLGLDNNLKRTIINRDILTKTRAIFFD